MTTYDGNAMVMESFTASTDASGNDDLVLSETPVSINSIIATTGTGMRTVEKVSLTSKTLTILVRKIGTKANTTLGSLPASVTKADTIQTYTSAGGSNVAGNNIGVAGAIEFDDAHTHNTQITKIYEHDHGLTDDSTLNAAASETDIPVTVIYAKAVS